MTEFFKILFKRHCCPELKFEKIFHLWSFFVELWGFEYCHLADLGQLTRNIKRRFNPSEKLFQIGWRKIISHKIFVTRSEIYHFEFYMNFSFYFVTFNFFVYYCFIDLKRQSEHSRLRPDKSSLVGIRTQVFNILPH